MLCLLQLLGACLFLKAPREVTASKRRGDKALLHAASSVELISQVSDLHGIYLTLSFPQDWATSRANCELGIPSEVCFDFFYFLFFSNWEIPSTYIVKNAVLRCWCEFWWFRALEHCLRRNLPSFPLTVLACKNWPSFSQANVPCSLPITSSNTMCHLRRSRGCLSQSHHFAEKSEMAHIPSQKG